MSSRDTSPSARLRPGRPPGATPRYRTIAEDLGRRLAAKEWPAGQRIPSFHQLARDYGVGIKTIQLALKVIESEGRVCIRPDRPTVAAIGLPLITLMKTALGVVINHGIARTCEPGGDQELWHGIARHADRIGLTLVVLSDDRIWKKEFPAGLRELPLAGLLLCGPFSEMVLRQYEKMSVPKILLDQPGADCKFHSVAVANYEGAFDTTLQLIERGHRRLAFIRSLVGSLNDVDPDSKERQVGFVAACKKARLKDDDTRVFSAGFNKTSPAIKELVRTVPAFTAILCANADHAVKAEREAESIGVIVPRDLSIASFRAASATGRDWSGPQINFEEFGRIGIDLLVNKPRQIKRVRVETTWHEGETIARVTPQF